MTKFKGRSSIKQYMPMKPVKRGIKLWTRCDAKTGHVCDTRIYCGKEDSCQQGTLGERAVKTLCSTLRNQEVVLLFDRFFTSTSLMHTLPFPEKTGESCQVPCPTAIADYNKYMGGVDLTNQMVTVYNRVTTF